ncbi:response regulator transcription factor [Pseudahrensia aquimaris]|uniref:Response regulator transcription factor n=1 Tax=Pseudahrensia aquimaris TaxID=744461 RepID=A0ABW3FE60_9HYPH
MNVLIVEDDLELSSQLCKALEDADHTTVHAENGEDGLRLAQQGNFDVMVVDRMMPRLDGLSMISRLRERGIDTPALILSALGQVDDRVEGLRAGGDDYLAKPYAFVELLARLEVLAKRNERAQVGATIEVADLKLDRISHKAYRGGEEIVLQPREYRLLEYLARNTGDLVTRTMLLQNVWDLNFDPQTNVIDVHMSRLRAKIDKNFDVPLIHTVRGVGYRFGVGG